MIKEKEKGGGARLKDEPNDPTEPGELHLQIMAEAFGWPKTSDSFISCQQYIAKIIII